MIISKRVEKELPCGSHQDATSRVQDRPYSDRGPGWTVSTTSVDRFADLNSLAEIPRHLVIGGIRTMVSVPSLSCTNCSYRRSPVVATTSVISFTKIHAREGKIGSQTSDEHLVNPELNRRLSRLNIELSHPLCRYITLDQSNCCNCGHQRRHRNGSKRTAPGPSFSRRRHR